MYNDVVYNTYNSTIILLLFYFTKSEENNNNFNFYPDVRYWGTYLGAANLKRTTHVVP